MQHIIQLKAATMKSKAGECSECIRMDAEVRLDTPHGFETAGWRDAAHLRKHGTGWADGRRLPKKQPVYINAARLVAPARQPVRTHPQP